MFSRHSESHRKPARFGKRISVIGVAVGALALVAGPAMAASQFDNGSFESGSYSGGGFETLTAGTTSANAMNDWTVTQGSVDWVDGSYWLAQDGSKSIDMNGTPTPGYPSTIGAIAQTFTTIPGATYGVQFSLAANPQCGTGQKTVLVDTGGTPAPFSSSTSVQTASPWTEEMFTFTANSSGTTTLTFSADPSNISNCGAVVDNVIVTAIYYSGAQCKDGGWATMTNPDTGLAYKNQGQCVSHFATSGDTPIGS